MLHLIVFTPTALAPPGHGIEQQIEEATRNEAESISVTCWDEGRAHVGWVNAGEMPAADPTWIRIDDRPGMTAYRGPSTGRQQWGQKQS
jgi:hypothetical protein